MTPFNAKEYTVEYVRGNVKIIKKNIFLENVTDMVDLEFWEYRLEQVNQDFVVAFKKLNNKIVYTIFCNSRSKGSKFK